MATTMWKEYPLGKELKVAIFNEPVFYLYYKRELGSDLFQCPAEDFESRRKGNPKSGKGDWLNSTTGEKHSCF